MDKINEYPDVAITIDDDSVFDIDQYSAVLWPNGTNYLTHSVKWSVIKSLLGSGNLGTTDLVQTDTVRNFTLGSSEVAGLLVFRNSALANSLTINGQCDVYNTGLQGVISNTFFGNDVGRNATGGKNTAFGAGAIAAAEANEDSVAIGHNAGRYVTGGTVANDNGTKSIYIGVDTAPSKEDDDNSIIIGDGAVGAGSNTTVLGNPAITKTNIFGLLNSPYYAGAGNRNIAVDANGNFVIDTSNTGNTSIITNTVNTGGIIATHDDGTGSTVDIKDNLTSLGFAFSALTYTDELGNDTVINLGELAVDTNIYNSNGTIGAGRVATLTDTLTFKDGTLIAKGAGDANTKIAFRSVNNSDQNIITAAGDRRVGFYDAVDPLNNSVAYPGDAAYAPMVLLRTGSDTYGFAHTDGNIELTNYLYSSAGSVQGAGYGTTTAHDLHIMVGDVYRARFNTNGDVGIGPDSVTTTLEAKLHVYGLSTLHTTNAFKASNSNNSKSFTYRNDGVIVLTEFVMASLPPVAAGGVIIINDATNGRIFSSDGVNWLNDAGVAAV